MQHYVSKITNRPENEFTKYLKLDRQSPRAISAQFYLAEIEYQQQDFEGALDDYTDVGPRLSDPAQARHGPVQESTLLIGSRKRRRSNPRIASVAAALPSLGGSHARCKETSGLAGHAKFTALTVDSPPRLILALDADFRRIMAPTGVIPSSFEGKFGSFLLGDLPYAVAIARMQSNCKFFPSCSAHVFIGFRSDCQVQNWCSIVTKRKTALVAC